MEASLRPITRESAVSTIALKPAFLALLTGSSEIEIKMHNYSATSIQTKSRNAKQNL